MPARPKRPAPSASGTGGRSSINMSPVIGAAADTENPSVSDPNSADYSAASDAADLKGDTRASANYDAMSTATPANMPAQFAAPTFWQRLVNTPGAQAYYQQQLQFGQAANQLANQKALSLYNAQTVDPLLQANTTAALTARAPIQAQLANANRYGISYNDAGAGASLAYQTYTTAQNKDQALNNSLAANYLNDQLTAEARRPHINQLVDSADAANVSNNNYSTAFNVGRIPFGNQLGATTAQLGIGQNQLDTTRVAQQNAFLASHPNFSGDTMQTSADTAKMQLNRLGDINLAPGTTIGQLSPDNVLMRTISMPALGYDLNAMQAGNLRKTVGQPVVNEMPKSVTIPKGNFNVNSPTGQSQQVQVNPFSTAQPVGMQGQPISNQDVINSIQSYLQQQEAIKAHQELLNRQRYNIPLSVQ